jgi:hypothetical protein
MLRLVIGLAGVSLAMALVTSACGGTATSGFGDGGAGSGGSSGGFSGGSGGFGGGGGAGGSSGIPLGGDSGTGGGGDGNTSTVATIYANTDTQLYTLDPMSNKVAAVGTFSGMSGSTYDSTVTDCAVDAEGDVYVNTETVVYKASLPATFSATATVALTQVAAIATASKDQSFYALAFAPTGFLGSGETLIGGDSTGELWSIDTSGGAVQDLGNFGAVPGSSSGKIFALSGDMVFYTSAGVATGLATIRECDSKGESCTSNNDYLASIDMTALSTAYTSKTPATSLLGGIYGGSSTSVGPGTSYGEIFGLGAWEGSVFGFTRAETSSPPNLISISTTSGVGSLISSSFGFTTGGWSGAGVTTTTTIKVPPPPPPPK